MANSKVATMPVSVFRDVLKRAFHVVKINKFLWVFGFFASFLGLGGEFESLTRDYSNIGQTSSRILDMHSLMEGGVIWTMLANIRDAFSTQPVQAFFFILMIVIVGLVLLWLAIVAQIALFDSVNKINKNQPATHREGFVVGNKFFMPVLLLNVIVKVILYGLLVVLGLPLISWLLVRDNLWGGFIFVFLLFFIYIPLTAIAAFIVKYAIAYIVIQGKRAGEAMRLAWALFKKNWLVSFEMAVVVLALGVAYGLAIILTLGLIAVPFALIGIAAMFFGSGTGLIVAITLGGIAWFITVAVLGGIFVSYQYTAWTLLFLKLVEDKAPSKLMRWFSKLPLVKPL
ncbi:MAG: hypothetical protein WCT27_01780 [Patescibacteria group bacterium]|jgi:hypothetical protein